MIQFHQVEKKFPDNAFGLSNLNFKVEPGEFVFIIGPSGSGKTSVIRMMIREERPTAGRIYFDDFDITRLSRNSVYKLRRQIGVVFQDYKLIPDKNVYENVAFAMEVAGRKQHEIKDTVPSLLDIVGLTERQKAFPEHLSGGEMQRVAIARAVANNPRVLIADEPTGNLDPASAWDIVQILTKINNWGTTVIMSTHGTDIVNTLNKRVIQLRDGAIVRDDDKGRYEITEGFEAKFVEEDGEGENEADDKDAADSSDSTDEPESKESGKKGLITIKMQNSGDKKEKKRGWGLGRFFRKEKSSQPEVVADLSDEFEEVESIAEEIKEEDKKEEKDVNHDFEENVIEAVDGEDKNEEPEQEDVEDKKKEKDKKKKGKEKKKDKSKKDKKKKSGAKRVKLNIKAKK